jgi:hypothetical protein
MEREREGEKERERTIRARTAADDTRQSEMMETKHPHLAALGTQGLQLFTWLHLHEYFQNSQ